MEWVLQVVDEIDDAIGVVRHGWLSVHVQIVLAAGLVIAAATAPVSLATFKLRAARPRARS